MKINFSIGEFTFIPLLFSGEYDMGIEYEYRYGKRKGIIVHWLWFMVEIIND